VFVFVCTTVWVCILLQARVPLAAAAGPFLCSKSRRKTKEEEEESFLMILLYDRAIQSSTTK
jgi:hypothetical protein